MANNTKPNAKRRLKNPQTIREKALKAQAEAKKPTQSSKVLGQSKRIFTPIKSLGRIFRIKPFRLIGRVIAPRYVRNSWQELRQVKWPNRKETRQLTVAVMIFSIIFGVLVAGVDYGLDKVFKQVILK